MKAHVAIIHVKTRNEAITIGALVIQKELQMAGINVDICTYKEAHKYKVALVSMTSTWDLYDFYKQMKLANWKKRQFISVLGGFGCQNPFALRDFIDVAYFGRAEDDIVPFISDILAGRDYMARPHVTGLMQPKDIVYLRPVQRLYDFDVKYGKGHATWKEEFTGCPFSCKFCHYTWNRDNVREGDTTKYINDGISSGSPEIMIKDVLENTEKLGRFTTAMDGYSERLRFLYGKPISWEMIEEAFDHTAAFKGNSYIKLYNIANFPTETDADEQEFIDFCQSYCKSTSKKDGILSVEVFNTAFRPSINTPMQRMPVRIFPEVRKENLLIARGSGIVIKYTHLIQGAWMHLQDVISIRYQESHHDIIDYIAMDPNFNKMNNAQKIDHFVNRYDINPFIREYAIDEPFISDRIRVSKHRQIVNQEKFLEKKMCSS